MNAALPPRSAWHALLERALREDLGPGDATSNALIDPDARGAARVEARAPLVACGLPLAAAAFRALDRELEVRIEVREGAEAAAGAALLRISGRLRPILAAERTALNFLGRLCGIAGATRRYVEAVAGTGCRIADTRKTIPGWRVLDKYATAVGGAENQRMGLYDALLIKDNHRAAAGGAVAAWRRARAQAPPHLRIQLEVESEAEAAAAVEAGADWLLLDNCDPDTLRRIAARLGDRALLEASGGITLANVRAVAETGVHRVSIGALTHSVVAADVALELEGTRA